jgi:hypothetical protein
MELSPGDIADRVSILKIKLEYLTDEKKLECVQNELAILNKYLKHDTTKLEQVNKIIWDVENEIRLCELREDFGPLFVRLARLVYLTNDYRAEVKRQINTGSSIAEVKQYTDYKMNDRQTIGILTHMGMGDHIVCNAMIRHFVREYNVVTYVKHHYVDSVRHMFRDLGPELTIVPVKDDQEAWVRQEPKTIRTGIFYGPNWDSTKLWCRSFYANVDLDPQIMRTGFFLLRSRDAEEKFYKQCINHIGTDKYVVVHDDPERYSAIQVNTDLPVVRIGRGQFPIESSSIFDYCTLIERAQEYHGFDSSFMWLVELARLRPKETTFLHRIRGYCSPGYEEFEMISNGTPP